jgi:S1-C subfamily serine protease
VGVTLLVASLVFLGLRIVRVSVTSETDTTASDGESSVAVSTVPSQSEGASSTTAVESAPSVDEQPGAVNWDELARSVVFIEVGGSCGWVGSGTLILDGSYVLTNWHVSGGGECPLQVGLTENPSTPPRDFYPATVVVWDSQVDLAIVQLQDSTGAPLSAPNRRPVAIADTEVRLGETVRLLGYPVVREDQFESGELYTLTLTDGSVSGVEDFGMRSGYNPIDSRTNDYEVWGEYLKHTATQNQGVSGGGAFNARGELVAVPTAGGEKLELMRSVRFAKALIGNLDR